MIQNRRVLSQDYQGHTPKYEAIKMWSMTKPTITDNERQQLKSIQNEMSNINNEYVSLSEKQKQLGKEGNIDM